MGRVSHFEINADDPKRAAEFYRHAAGWDVKDWGGPQADKDAGGTVLMEKTAVPGVGYFAYCKDTEGNVFGIIEGDLEAK